MNEKTIPFVAEMPTIITHVMGHKLDEPIELKAGEKFDIQCVPNVNATGTYEQFIASIAWTEFYQETHNA